MALTLATLMMTCAPLVHPTTLRALIEVESGGNPFAVSINHPRALRAAGLEPPAIAPPHSAREALELTRALRIRGMSTSVGLAQVNVEHLAGRGLRIADLLDPCINLSVAQRVLIECAAKQSQRLAPSVRLRQTLLCYNAGDQASGLGNHYALDVMRAALGHVRRAVRPSGDPR